MPLDPLQFMQTIANRVDFRNQEKAIFKRHSDWAAIIAPDMANCFYNQLNQDPETQQRAKVESIACTRPSFSGFKKCLTVWITGVMNMPNVVGELV